MKQTGTYLEWSLEGFGPDAYDAADQGPYADTLVVPEARATRPFAPSQAISHPSPYAAREVLDGLDDGGIDR